MRGRAELHGFNVSNLILIRALERVWIVRAQSRGSDEQDARIRGPPRYFCHYILRNDRVAFTT